MPLPAHPEFRRFARWAHRIRLIGRILSRTTIAPAELPDAHGRPIVMVSNHRSLADVFISIDALDQYRTWARCLVRQRYMSTPVLGRWLNAVGCIGGGDGSREAYTEAIETLQAGRAVAVMAEGRVTPPEERDELGLGPFRPGFVEIARAGNAVIMPIAIVGSDGIWGSGKRMPRIPWRGRPRVRVSIGEAIDIDAMTDEEALETTRQAIGGMIAAA